MCEESERVWARRGCVHAAWDVDETVVVAVVVVVVVAEAERESGSERAAVSKSTECTFEAVVAGRRRRSGLW